MRQDAKLLSLDELYQGEPLFQFRNSTPSAQETLSEGEGSSSPRIRSTVFAQMLSVREHERQRLGQELHDSAGQLLISLQLSVARLKAGQLRMDESLLDEIQRTVSELDKELRGLAYLHYPAELGERNLSEAIESLVRGFGRRTGIRTRFKCSGETDGLAQPASVTLLRVAQEALVNVHRHSHASAAKVTLEKTANSVRLTVSDDGVGMPPVGDARIGRGIGLQSMRYRLEIGGGRFDIRRLKHGTKISASLPLVA